MGRKESRPLPPLRQDLSLLEGPPTAEGEPTWTIFDPVRNQYFRLGYTAFELLSRWGLGDWAALLRAVAAETTVPADEETVTELILFLQQHNLLRHETPDGVEEYCRQHAAAKQSLWQWLLHHYLFFRIPLVRPDRFLTKTLRLVLPLYSRTALYLVLGAGGLGMVMAAQQSERFVHTFRQFLSVEGAIYYALALGSVKVLHELGHAYTVKRYGGRVPTMGLGFLVMMPVLYTDATDTWRLSSRRQRAAIAAAGMITEISVALLATLAWSFLPDGPARSAAFFLATVSWVMTLTINLSPFTRFDGYFVLSDWLGVDNLQSRAFALARWRLREWLFGLGDPPPERFPAHTHRAVLLYAYAAWLYRLILFTGIALLVYHLFFKLLGLLLLAVELGWFVGLPMARELGHWWALRTRLRFNPHSVLTLAAFGGVLLLLFVPWQHRVALPAIERAARHAALYPVTPAQLRSVAVKPGERVSAGQVLYRLGSPELENKLRRTESDIRLQRMRLRRQAGSDAELQNRQVLEKRLAADLAARRGLLDQKQRLRVRAPFAGRLRDVPPALTPGRWLSAEQPLGRLVAPVGSRIVAYVTEPDLQRIRPGARARFYPDDPTLAPQNAVVQSVATVNVKALDQPALASVFQGEIPVTRNRHDRLVPIDAIYRITLSPPTDVAAPERIIRGHVEVTIAARSPFGQLWRHMAGVLIRESGF